jgi:hypothetical protein
MYFYEVLTSHLAGEILITKPCDEGAQPVPVVVEFYDGIIFHRAGWSTSLPKSHGFLA